MPLPCQEARLKSLRQALGRRRMASTDTYPLLGTLNLRHQSITPVVAWSALASDPVDPTVSNTQLVIGDRTWDIDLNKDPPQQKTAEPRRSPPVGEQDLLVKQMVELSMAAAASGSARRNMIHQDGPPSSVESCKGTNDSLSIPTTTTSASAAPRDFRNSAEMVIGSYTLAQAPSRSASPNPPRVVLAAPPPPFVPPSMLHIPVEQIMGVYQCPFPGEPRSRSNLYVGPPPPIVNQNPDQGAPCPMSRGRYPGVGTQSLIPCPQSPAKGPGPTAVQPYNRGPPPAASTPPSNGALICSMSVSRRPVMPTNLVGIALGPDGRVVHNMMVQPGRQAPVHYQQPGLPPQVTQPPQAYPGYHDSSQALMHPQQQPPPKQPPPSRNDYVVVPQGACGGSRQVQLYNYGHPPQHPVYDGGTIRHSPMVSPCPHPHPHPLSQTMVMALWRARITGTRGARAWDTSRRASALAQVLVHCTPGATATTGLHGEHERGGDVLLIDESGNGEGAVTVACGAKRAGPATTDGDVYR